MAEEMVDILDDFGRKTGRTIWKKEAHTQGLRHGGVHVWIYNSSGEVLLQRRRHDKEIYPGTLDISAAGHMSAGDEPVAAAIRETLEEVGVKLVPEDLLFIGVTRTDQLIPPKNWMHRVYDWNYIVCIDRPADKFIVQQEELDGVLWKPLDEFEADVRDNKRAAKYSPRPLYLYDMALYEIRKALGIMAELSQYRM